MFPSTNPETDHWPHLSEFASWITYFWGTPQVVISLQQITADGWSPILFAFSACRRCAPVYAHHMATIAPVKRNHVFLVILSVWHKLCRQNSVALLRELMGAKLVGYLKKSNCAEIIVTGLRSGVFLPDRLILKRPIYEAFRQLGLFSLSCLTHVRSCTASTRLVAHSSKK